MYVKTYVKYGLERDSMWVIWLSCTNLTEFHSLAPHMVLQIPCWCSGKQTVLPVASALRLPYENRMFYLFKPSPLPTFWKIFYSETLLFTDRCIPCKGSRFPPTLPRPAVAILSFKLPYCHIATEKGQMEVCGNFTLTLNWRHTAFDSAIEKLVYWLVLHNHFVN